MTSSGTDETYQVCTRCVMDRMDSDTEFDEQGICNHCRNYEKIVQRVLLPKAERPAALQRIVEMVKAQGQGAEYDCVIGVSGGVDSSYVAYLVKKLGLRPLAVHMDNGWDSELAVSNIEKFLRKLDIDLQTVVLDWEEFRDLQLAFLKASVSDAEVPTDHAIWAVLYQAAAVRNIRYIILGSSTETESLASGRWTYGIHDWKYIQSISGRFGTRPLRSFPHYSNLDKIYYRFVKRIKVFSILDYISYNKAEAMGILENELEWRPYGGKHYESIYTRFFQGYILPRKFNMDKRKGHLSALVMSGQLRREDALAELRKPIYSGYMFEEDMEYVLKKFELTEGEFEDMMQLPNRTFRDYPNSLAMQDFIRRLRVMAFADKLGFSPKL